MTILTPKGYSSARRSSSERPATPAEPTPPPAQPAPPAQPSPSATQTAEEAAGRRQVQLKFPPQVVGVNCPNCGTPYPVQVFSIVDAGQDPILKSLLLSGQLNVAVCPRCGTGGSLASAMLYHDPAHDFLGVYVPEQVPVNKQQEIIGQLSKRLMDGLPPEARRGYMLTPKQFLSFQSLLEAVLEHEGITREMMDRQRRRLQLIEQALVALQDPQGFKSLVADRDAEMDDEFFGMLQTLIASAASGGDGASAEALLQLRERLIELTTWGKGVQRQRAAIARLKPDTTPSQLLEMIVATEEEGVVDALVTAARPLIDYTFFQQLTDRSEAAQRRGDAAEATRLAQLRDHILDYTKRLDELQRVVLQQATQVLNDILASNNIEQAVAERAPYIDQNFLAVLAANLQEAERRGAKAAVKRLQQVWDAAVGLMQEEAPPEIALINELLNAEYPGGTRQLLSQNRDLISDELIAAMADLADQLDAEGAPEVASRLRQIRSQAQLMR